MNDLVQEITVDHHVVLAIDVELVGELSHFKKSCVDLESQMKTIRELINLPWLSPHEVVHFDDIERPHQHIIGKFDQGINLCHVVKLELVHALKDMAEGIRDYLAL